MQRDDPFVKQLLVNLRIGMTRDQVQEVLGEPHDADTGSRRRRLPVIFRYGDIELHFGEGPEGRLLLVYFEDDNHQPHTLLTKETSP